MQSLFRIREDIVKVGQRLFISGMLPGGDGNISVRVDDRLIAITPTELSKGFLSPADIILVDRTGKILDGRFKPTSELPVHLLAYNERKDINACVHTHPPYVVAFTVSGKKLPPCVLPEIVVRVGEVVDVGYATPSTEEVALSIKPFIHSASAFILKNHGLLVLGRNLDDAVNMTESIEHFAKIVFLASQLGNVEQIPIEEREKLMRMRNEYLSRGGNFACNGCVLQGGGCIR